MPEELPVVTEPVEPQAPEPTKDPMIPKSRFDEINSKNKDLAARLAELEAEKTQRDTEAQEAERKRAEEQGKFEDLYRTAESELNGLTEKATTYESRAKSLESLIESMVEQKIESIGKDYAELIPEGMTPEAKLAWISKAESKGLFGKTELPEIGGRKASDPGQAPKVNPEKISALDKIKMGLGK